MNEEERQTTESMLTHQQRMMIRRRKAIRKKPSIWYLIIICILLFGFVIGIPYIQPVDTNAHLDTIENPKLTMTFVGDIMLGRNVQIDAEAHGYEQYFEHVSSYWKHADFSFVNLESAVLQDGKEYQEAEKTKNSIYLSANRMGVQALLNAGVNVLSCANNHAGDYGREAIADLCDWLDGYAPTVTYAGIGRNKQASNTYKILKKNGISIGFVSLTDTYYKNFIANNDEAGAFATTDIHYNQIISEAKKENDLVVVYIHFGEENEVKANKEQKSYAHQMIDAGADIIIGSHPHVLQEIELYKDGIIFYSLGNFIFDQGGTYSRDTVLVQYDLDQDGNGYFELIPMRLNQGIPSHTNNIFFQKRINRELCQGLDEDKYFYNENGNIVIPAVNLK